MDNQQLEALIKETAKVNILDAVDKKEKYQEIIGMGIYPLVQLIEMMGFTNKTEYLDPNGCDYDFTYEFEKNGIKYDLWGSLTDCTFMFGEV